MSAFDKYLHAVIVRATHEVHEDGSATIDAHHLLLSLAADQGSTAQRVLASAGLDHAAVREALDREFEHSLSMIGVSPGAYDLPRPSHASRQPKLGASARLALERSFASARKKDLGSAHLLLGILKAHIGTVPRALALAGVDQAELADRVRQTLSARSGAEPAKAAGAVSESAPDSKAQGYEAIRRLLQQAVAQGGLPGILAEVRDGDRQWFGTAGVADTRTGRERSQQDRFRIGSISKTFVATVVLQMAAEGRLSLDDTAEQWLPSVVHGHHHDGSGVNIRMLLNHTSGIFNYTDDQEALNRSATHTPESLVRIAVSHPPTFTPGSGWAYSNTNYILAGMIIERATGRALAEEIAERISRPLGLTGTYLPHGSDPTIHGPHSRHYTKLFRTDPGAPVHDATELDSSMFWAAGGMISTAGDLNRFFGALLGGRILPPDQQHDMFTTVPTRDWISNAAYGLGVSSVRLPCGETVWGMGGALFGSWSYSYGARGGEHMVTANVNGDWCDGGWKDPIGIFTDLLQAKFCGRSGT
ncbi:serine hydrolase [Streptomyces sp. NPDC020125]|uniref:serine hydrolase domain-containing protein n=1 Tax=Streptomyces sp. NPDC020125 TaxID=3154593 RepID=UPI00340917E6